MTYRRPGHSRKLSEVDVLDYDAIFIPGRLGPMVDNAKRPYAKKAVIRLWSGENIVSAACLVR
ncbi:hypothetical protein D3C76_1511790 [compost metagenome]